MCELRLKPRIRAAKKLAERPPPPFLSFFFFLSKSGFQEFLSFSLNPSTLSLKIRSMGKKLEGADVTHQNPLNSSAPSPYDGSCNKKKKKGGGEVRNGKTNVSQSRRGKTEVESLQPTMVKSSPSFHRLSKNSKYSKVTHSGISCDFRMNQLLMRDSLGVFADHELTGQMGPESRRFSDLQPQ